MNKIEVNGDNVDPVYKFLKEQKSGLLGMTRIKWNFEKFVNRSYVLESELIVQIPARQRGQRLQQV